MREYTYVHPYNPGWGAFGPKWKYVSTITFTWWFLLVASLFMLIPLLKKKKVGFLGLALLILVGIRPLVQSKFPEETAREFYEDRKDKLNRIVQKTPVRDQEYSTIAIFEAGFEQLIVKDSVYYFFCYEGFEFGLCYKDGDSLPSKMKKFDRNLKITPVDLNWYEFDN